VDHGPPACLWQRPHPLFWADSRAARGKITINWYTQPPKLMCNFSSICIIYIRGRGLVTDAVDVTKRLVVCPQCFCSYQLACSYPHHHQAIWSLAGGERPMFFFFFFIKWALIGYSVSVHIFSFKKQRGQFRLNLMSRCGLYSWGPRLKPQRASDPHRSDTQMYSGHLTLTLCRKIRHQTHSDGVLTSQKNGDLNYTASKA
jgi:hypothetical protein